MSQPASTIDTLAELIATGMGMGKPGRLEYDTAHAVHASINEIITGLIRERDEARAEVARQLAGVQYYRSLADRETVVAHERHMAVAAERDAVIKKLAVARADLAADRTADRIADYADRLDAEANRVRSIPKSDQHGETYNGGVATGLIAAARMLREWADEAAPQPAGGTNNTEDRRAAVLADVAADMKADATAFDGQPFNGRTVATYLGNQGAAIAALADIIATLLPDGSEAVA